MNCARWTAPGFLLVEEIVTPYPISRPRANLFSKRSVAGRAAVSPVSLISCEKNPEESRACYDVPSIVSVPYPYRRNIMSKGMDSKKSDKKEPAKTMKEKKAEKKIKKAEKK
jgi:hypothetical protein